MNSFNKIIFVYFYLLEGEINKIKNIYIMVPKGKDSSWKNLKDYNSGKDKLKNAILQHPEEEPGAGSVYNYMKGEINRSGWVMPFDQYVNMGSRKPKKPKK